MLVVALDTATPAVTAGVLRRTEDAQWRVLAERVTVDPRAHVELLTGHLLGALAEAGCAMSDVDAIVCGAGPGPFTGLRVGMVTAAALGDALGVPVHGVCSLDALVPSTTGPRVPYLVVTDARRREVYWAAYDARHRRVSGPRVQRPAELAAQLGEPGGPQVACGAGAAMYADVLGLPVVGPEYPTVAGLAAAATGLFGGEPAPLAPMYLRRPDAAVPGPAKAVLSGGQAGR